MRKIDFIFVIFLAVAAFLLTSCHVTVVEPPSSDLETPESQGGSPAEWGSGDPIVDDGTPTADREPDPPGATPKDWRTCCCG